MTTTAVKTGATYQDVLEAPESQIAEIVDGTLYLSPRPAIAATRVGHQLANKLGTQFDNGGGGPGGWIILFEAELHLGGHVLVPDISGWRRSRLPSLPAGPAMTLVPDWICEVLSPSTEQYDRTLKLQLYATLGVKHAWLVSSVQRTVETFKRVRGKWTFLAAYRSDETVRAEPFEALELDLSTLWADLPTRANEPPLLYGG